jgi:hypothetical protein
MLLNEVSQARLPSEGPSESRTYARRIHEAVTSYLCSVSCSAALTIFSGSTALALE